MHFVRKIENKAKSFFFKVSEGLNLPIINHSKKWSHNLINEVDFWDDYIKTGGSVWKDDFQSRLDPNQPLQENIAELLPSGQKDVKILDVGAGPLTSVGKKYDGFSIEVIPVDPLADEYDKLIAKYNLQLPVRTRKGDAEKLSELFPEGAFDLAYARNCLDHSYDPEKAILEMMKMVKKGNYVLLEHQANEAKHQNYRGLHQWNFSSIGDDFIISSPNGRVNFSKKHQDICKTTCSHNTSNDWLVTKIEKL